MKRGKCERPRFMIKALTFIAAIAAATPSSAKSYPALDRPFATAPVEDLALEGTRGTANPGHLLTPFILRSTVERQSRDDLFFGASIAHTQMDVWWGTVGSQLIANAVRAE